MIGDSLPHDSHVARYVRPSLIQHEEVDGSAFLSRQGENELSVNWLEVLDGDDELRQMDEVRRLSRLDLRRNGRFAKFNVGEAKRSVSRGAKEAGICISLDVVEAPLCGTAEFEADPSHATVTGIPPSDSDQAMLVADLIAQCVIYPLYPTRTD